MTKRLIKSAGYLPCKDDKGEWLVGEETSIFYKRDVQESSVIEIIDGDRIGIDQITALLSNSPVFNDQFHGGYPENHLLNIKVFVFSEKPGHGFVACLRDTYSGCSSSFSPIACIALCLKSREIFLELGLIYPFHEISNVLSESMREQNEEELIDINSIINEKLKGPQSAVMDENEGAEAAFTHLLLKGYLFLWSLGLVLKIWTGVDLYIFRDSDILFVLCNVLTLLVVGEMVEKNFGTMRFLLFLTGGFAGGILCSSFLLFFVWIAPLCGAFVYLLWHVKDALIGHKLQFFVFLSFLLSVFIYCAVIGYAGGLLGLTGIPVGFFIAGTLGFEKEVVSLERRKMNSGALACTLLLCVFKALFF